MSDIASAAADKAGAAERFEEAIVAAHRAGRPIAHIAREAGVSRTTVYETLDRRGAR